MIPILFPTPMEGMEALTFQTALTTPMALAAHTDMTVPVALMDPAGRFTGSETLPN